MYKETLLKKFLIRTTKCRLWAHIMQVSFTILQLIENSFNDTNSISFWSLAGPFRRFSMHMWQNACANTVRRVMVCEVYFPFSKI